MFQWLRVWTGALIFHSLFTNKCFGGIPENDWLGTQDILRLYTCFFSPNMTYNINNRSNDIGQSLAYQLNFLLSDSGFYIPARGWADLTNLYNGVDNVTGFDCFWITCDWSGSSPLLSYYTNLFESSDDLSLYSLSNYLRSSAISTNYSSVVDITNDFQVVAWGKFFGCNANNDTYCNFGYNYLSDDLKVFTQQSEMYNTLISGTYFDQVVNFNVSYHSGTTVTLIMPLVFQFDPDSFNNNNNTIDGFNQTKYNKAKDFCSNFTQEYLSDMFENIANWLGNDEYQFIDEYS